MGNTAILLSSIAYLSLLFGIAYLAHRRAKGGKSLINNPYTYSLSLAVYCTAWTYFGSVGKAADSGGLSFLAIYIGPILVAPLFTLILRKIILISKSQRITSIADFISARYGKSTNLGILVTIMAVIGIIPYVALQLKAIDSSYNILANDPAQKAIFLFGDAFPIDKALLIALVLVIFTILFGTRHLDPNERHEGLVAAIAVESIWKLIAFLAVGIFLTFGVFNGLGDLFQHASTVPEIADLFSFQDSGIDQWSWGWMVVLSMGAILLLPRQFHVMVVENTNVDFVEKAAWLFPLYLLLINLFVLPIACGGLLLFPDGGVEPDNFVLGIPLHYGQGWLALIAYLGGLSAATGMVIVELIALSIMISNNLVMPFLLRTSLFEDDSTKDYSKSLINIRRLSIAAVMLLAYVYYKWVGAAFSLVSIGLISFAAIAQFIPVVIGGLFWKRATKKGAIAGLLAGGLIWMFTLSLPTLAEVSILNPSILEEGYLGISWLNPYHLGGLSGDDHIAHAAFWSLTVNTFTYIAVSIHTIPKPIEVTQADLFVDIEQYIEQQGGGRRVLKREARFTDIQNLLFRFLGDGAAKKVLGSYAEQQKIDLKKASTVDADFINFAETHLAGAIGAASTKILLESVVREHPISLDEMLRILDQTQQVIQYSKALEKKSAELEATTRQLKAANRQLKELDRLKVNFITTVTHELRTPITSIKALAKILYDADHLEEDKRKEFLGIMVDESERVARLVNQVLDLEKVQSDQVPQQDEVFDFNQLVQRACKGLSALISQRNIRLTHTFPTTETLLRGDEDRLTQVVVNLLSNAIKFCNPERGEVTVTLTIDEHHFAHLSVRDNGRGISQLDQQIVFDKFTQLSTQETGKPTGSGLGLSISKEIVSQHGGDITVESAPDQGANFIVKLPLVVK